MCMRSVAPEQHHAIHKPEDFRLKCINKLQKETRLQTCQSHCMRLWTQQQHFVFRERVAAESLTWTPDLVLNNLEMTLVPLGV